LGDANTTGTIRLRLNGHQQTITGFSLGTSSLATIENQGGGNGVLTIDQAEGTTSTSTTNFIFRNQSAGTGTLGLVKTGAGTLDFSTYNTMNYSGGLTVQGGRLVYTNAAALGGGAITLAGGALDYNGSENLTIVRGLALAEATTSVLHNAAGRSTFSAAITGAGNLNKTGAGILDLTAANTYTGTTTVSAGTLLVNGRTAGGNLLVQSSATLGGSGTIGGNTVISSGATLSPGNSPGVLNILGDLTLEGTVVMELNGLTRGTLYDGIDVGGTLNYGGALTLNFGNTFNAGDSFNLFSFSVNNGSFDSITFEGSYGAGSLLRNASSSIWTGTIGGQDFAFYDVSGTLEVVPEPSTYALLILAGAGLAGHVCRRRYRG
jgi:autotransporter-associated beta strand protein